MEEFVKRILMGMMIFHLKDKNDEIDKNRKNKCVYSNLLNLGSLY
jgi:hypothetical protein